MSCGNTHNPHNNPLDPSNPHNLITCQQCVDFIADYLDSSLPADQRQEFDRHLAACPECIGYLESYKQTINLATKACDPCGPSAQGKMPESLIRAILAARRKSN